MPLSRVWATRNGFFFAARLELDSREGICAGGRGPLLPRISLRVSIPYLRMRIHSPGNTSRNNHEARANPAEVQVAVPYPGVGNPWEWVASNKGQL